MEDQAWGFSRPTKPQICGCGRLADPVRSRPSVTVHRTMRGRQRYSMLSGSTPQFKFLDAGTERALLFTGPFVNGVQTIPEESYRSFPPHFLSAMNVNSNHLRPLLDPSRPGITRSERNFTRGTVGRGAGPSRRPRSYAAGARDFLGSWPVPCSF